MAPPHAPVVLLAYARADHVKRTLDALAANIGAEQTDVFIYCDAARGPEDQNAVLATRAIVGTAGGFRSVSIIHRKENFGLARNVTEAVSEIITAHGRVIVLEDDIVTAPGFLQFMNKALDVYEDQSEIWHISGWNYPIIPDGLDDAFFIRVMNCWGWATWADRWRHFEREPHRLRDTFSQAKRHAFNLDGSHDFFEQVEDNATGSKVTWAIFWYATIFLRNGLCLNPTRSLVNNIGFDGTGENCNSDSITQYPLNGCRELSLPNDIQENTVALQRIRHSLRKSILYRILAKLRQFLKEYR